MLENAVSAILEHLTGYFKSQPLVAVGVGFLLGAVIF